MREALVPSLLVLVVTLAGCAVPEEVPTATADPAPARVPVAAWKGNLSEARFKGIVHSLEFLEAEDGTQLSLTLWLPDGLPEGETIPALLQLTPYQASRSDPVAGSLPRAEAWADYVLRGAAYVEANARGSDASAGCLDFGGPLDRADAKAFTGWIRAQSWSNGVVVADGVSHPGMGSLVAHVADANLTASLAHAPVVSYYRDEWYQGAKLDGQNNGVGYQRTELNVPGHRDPRSLLAQAAPCTGQTLLDFAPVDGPFTQKWAERDLARYVDGARAPVLLTQGFIDRNVFPDHVQSYWDALPDGFPKWVVWGWWYHGWPDMEGHPAEAFEDFRHRWLDATLFGADNGVLREPRVLVEDSTGTWHEGRDWPLEQSERVVLRPAADGSLSNATPEAGEVSYADRLGAQRGVWRDASAVFRTEPLDAPRLVNGAPVVELVASSSETSTKWVVYLLDEAPDGKWERVSHGYADSHWGEEGEWLDLEPGVPRNWTIHLMPTAVVLEEGHRLTLVVASQDPTDHPQGAPCFDDHRGGCHTYTGIVPALTAGRAVNTVHVGPEGTSVRLAWVDPSLTAKA